MKNILTLRTNEILDAGAYDNNVVASDNTIKSIIKSNILMDYSNGIRRAEIQIFPSDFQIANGIKIKNWANGDMIEVGEIVRIMNKEGNDFLQDKNGNDVIFKVVDRKVEYKGQIIITLVLQELKF